MENGKLDCELRMRKEVGLGTFESLIGKTITGNNGFSVPVHSDCRLLSIYFLFSQFDDKRHQKNKLQGG